MLDKPSAAVEFNGGKFFPNDLSLFLWKTCLGVFCKATQGFLVSHVTLLLLVIGKSIFVSFFDNDWLTVYSSVSFDFEREPLWYFYVVWTKEWILALLKVEEQLLVVVKALVHQTSDCSKRKLK